MTTETLNPESQGPEQLNELLRTPSSIKAVLFDLDGSLVDTEVVGIDVAVSICRDLGIELDPEEQQGFIGITVEKFYEELFLRRRIDQDVPIVLGRHFEKYEELIKTDVREFEGARSLPRELKSNGFMLAIVSGSTRSQVETILNTLEIREQFDIIISFDDIEKSKPDPEGYLKAASRLEASPSECLVIEDATAGIHAGKNAGMKVAGVINRGGQDLSFADFVIPSLATVRVNPRNSV